MLSNTTKKLLKEAGIDIDKADLTPEEIKTHKPTIVQVGENNEIISYGRK